MDAGVLIFLAGCAFVIVCVIPSKPKRDDPPPFNSPEWKAWLMRTRGY